MPRDNFDCDQEVLELKRKAIRSNLFKLWYGVATSGMLLGTVAAIAVLTYRAIMLVAGGR